jgi:hypothetical protein
MNKPLNAKVKETYRPDMYHYLFTEDGRQRNVNTTEIQYLQRMSLDILSSDKISYNSDTNRLVYESSSNRS